MMAADDRIDALYDAVRIAYGLTCNMPTTDANDRSDLMTARRHLLMAMRAEMWEREAMA